MSKKTFICLIAGSLAMLLWTPLESNLFVVLPQATSRLEFRGLQVLVGFISAVVLVLPLVLLLRPPSPRLGLIFVAAFLVSLIAAHVAVGGTAENLALLFQLPDTWVFLATSMALFWWAARRQAVQYAA